MQTQKFGLLLWQRVSVVIVLNWTVLCGCGRRMGGKNDSTASNEIVFRGKNG